MKRAVLLAASLATACLDAPPDTDGAGPPHGGDAAPICAAFSDWGTPVEVPEMSETFLASPTLSGDGRLLVWETQDDNLAAAYLDGGTATPVADSMLSAVNSADEERNPTLSADGLILWFSRGSNEDSHIYVSHRADPKDDFPIAEVVSGLETMELDGADVWDGGRELFLSALVAGHWQLVRASCEAPDNPERCSYLGPVAGLEAEPDIRFPSIRQDGLEIFFNLVDNTMVAARRAGSEDDFAIYDPLDFTGFDLELSSDASTLYANRGNRLGRIERSCATE